MADMKQNAVILDPTNLDDSMQQLAAAYDLDADALSVFRRVVGLYPRAVRMYVDEARGILFKELSLMDMFTFDIETDELVLLSCDHQTLVNAMIEMAMYLAGFATMLGARDEWVIEFTIGAWKPVKNRIKRLLDIPVPRRSRVVVGLPPSSAQGSEDESYPFRRLVSTYNIAAFYQMVVLAAREDVAVYFPMETHPKVLAVYLYSRRAMQEVARGIGIENHKTFNARLLRAIQHLEKLFDPASLPAPGKPPAHNALDRPVDLGMFSPPNRMNIDTEQSPVRPEKDPFEAFIEQLFQDDESDSEEPHH